MVYDDKSVLEQMHYSLIMQIMRHNNLAFMLDRPQTGSSFRKLLLGAVLATDMGVHFNFMAEFKKLVNGADFPELKRRVLVCQALIKCADISNPVSNIEGAVWYASLPLAESTVPRIATLGSSARVGMEQSAAFREAPALTSVCEAVRQSCR